MTNLDYLYNPEAAKKFFNKNYFLDKKLGFQVIENGTVLPYKDDGRGGLLGSLGGIVDSAGNFIVGTHVTGDTADKKYIPPPESILHSKETVIYLGMFFYVWGHVITDNISRLWFLKSEEFRTQFKDFPLIYITWGNQSLDNQQNFRRLLEILEVDIEKFRRVEQPTQFNKIILPERSFSNEDGFTSEYCETINIARDFALKNRTPTSCKKIYYFHGRRQIGEERIAEYFRSKGYTIIYPEKLTLDEQLNLLINAESFASTIGSSSHNSVFLRDNSEVVLISRQHNGFYSFQRIIDQVHDQNISYLDSSLSIFYTRNGPFCYIVSEQLKRFFGDKWDGYEEGDFKTFLQHVKKSLAEGRTVNPNAKAYYGKVLEEFMAQLKKREDLIVAANMPPHWENFQPSFSYQTHVHKKGWGDWKNENQISNDLEQKLDIQAIKINFPNHKVYYQVYYNAEEGWSEEVSNGEQAGTTGKTKAIYGVRIRLDEAGTKKSDILYRVHKFDGEWTDWAKNGEVIYSYGQKLNAIQIKLTQKEGI